MPAKAKSPAAAAAAPTTAAVPASPKTTEKKEKVSVAPTASAVEKKDDKQKATSPKEKKDDTNTAASVSANDAPTKKEPKVNKKEKTSTAAEKKEQAAEKKDTATDRPKNNVRVSSHRSKYLYADLTKHLLNDGEKEVVITALNASISDAVAVVEMLKSQKLVKVTKITTSRGQEESARRPGSDKIEIVVAKDADFDKIYAEQQKERESKKTESAKKE